MIIAKVTLILALAASLPALAAALPAPATSAAPSVPAAPDDVASPPPGALKTPSGLVMTVLKAGQGKQHPRPNDCVKMHFTAWKRDGSLLSSSRTWGEPRNQCLVTAFPGVAEALASMVVGEQRRVWVPANLTFTGDDEDRPPQVDATFDLELYEILRAPPTPRNLKSPPPTARKSSSGLAIEVLKRGRKTASTRLHPDEHSQVKLDFSGWTASGRLIESSVMAHHPAVFDMASVIPGWREALVQMFVGDKVRIWIPRALAYGDKPLRGQPKGDLIYELELLEIH